MDHPVLDRTSRYASLLAGRMGLDAQAMRFAAPLRDVGVARIPHSILLKPGPLTSAERREMERHAEIGWDMLRGSGNPRQELAAAIAWTHHERLDGSGYPRGLAGDDIPMAGQVAGIADVFGALVSNRPHRQPWPVEEALRIIRQERGDHFAPQLVDTFFELMAEILGRRLCAAALAGYSSSPRRMPSATAAARSETPSFS
jgi:response regulator RpfG family c-di-GMP phosphodiesterase